MLQIDREGMENAIKDFYEITKLKVTFYDKERNRVFSYPENNKGFCSCMMACPELARECERCDNKAMDICNNLRKPYVYTCHMKLLEGVNPIKMNNEVEGFVMVGQKIEELYENDVKKRIFDISKKFEIDGNKLLSYMDALERTSVSEMEAAMNVLTMCTSHLYRHRAIMKQGEDVPAYQIEEYLYENLAGDLSIHAICNHFHISKSKLYNISKKAFGIGFSDYVREIRVKEGKKALQNTAKSINQIADEVGFSDANYFIRVFKNEVGMTPSKYRKMRQNEEK